MTKKFDDKARAKLMETYVEPDMSDVTPLEIDVRPITCKEARPYIAAFHYSHTMPDSSRFVFGAFARGVLAGVCVFGMGCGKNQYTAIWPDAKNGQYVELTRLWLEDSLGRNSESHVISRALRQLPRDIRMVVSFSDESHGHYGCIYQATNFLYLGKNGGGKMLRSVETGVESHPRLLGIYRMRHPEYRDYTNDELMRLLGYEYVTGGAKHRYVMFRDKKLQKILGIKSKPYPKGEN